jgi:hypothetical protein
MNEMNAITTTALIGTTQQQQPVTTGTPVDALVDQVATDGGDERERTLLLRAATYAIYRQAGQVPQTSSTLPEPASTETLSVCSPVIASFLEKMLDDEHEELLPELLARLRSSGLRIPHNLLTNALDIEDKELRPAMFHVLGERGRWLSQFNPAWQWVAQYLSGTDDELLANAETLWQEGTTGQRQRILQLLRVTNSTQAREWLQAAWKQEKAEVRSDLLQTFEVGLSGEDEAFLEKALDDRASGVRSLAAVLLARLDTSAFANRMRERADAMLDYTTGALHVTLPQTLDKDWVRDGITAKPTGSGTGERTWWFQQVIALVPPSHWTERFGITIEQLLALTASINEWQETLVLSWSKAALLHKSFDWMTHLWDYCFQHAETSLWSMHVSLLQHMPQDEAEARVLKLLTHPVRSKQNIWDQALLALPTPWSEHFAFAYLHTLRTYIATFKPETRYSPFYDSWYQSLSTAATAMPATCFSAALLDWTMPVPEAEEQKTVWQFDYWRQELKKFTDAIRIRQTIHEEIVL